MLKFLKLNLDNRLKGNRSSVPLGGRYQVMRRLAAGGFGQTFLAQDLHLPGHPVCVVKQLKPRFSDAGSLETARRLFDTEANVLYALGNHPQIPRLMAHFEEDREFYLAQEYVEGEPLDNVLVSARPWKPERVVALLRDILQVLSFVHDKNVIHRDIKPANMLCRRSDGQIVLIDFGAVKKVNTGLISKGGKTNLTVSIGTEGYMPSEQLSGQPRFSSDIYAVGMVAIQALTGVEPRHIAENPHTGEIAWREANLAVTSTLNKALVNVIDHMVYYDFRVRYETAAVALQALQALPTEIQETIPDRWYEPKPLTEPRQNPIDLSQQTPQADSHRPAAAANRQDPLNFESDWLPDTTAIAPPPSVFKAKRGWFFGAMAGGVGFVMLWAGIGFVQSRPRDQVTTSSNTPVSVEATRAVSPSDTASPEASASEDEVDVEVAASDAPPAEVPPKTGSEAGKAGAQAIAMLEKADALRQQGQYLDAIAAYDQAIASGPRDNTKAADAHWGKCYSLNRLQRAEAALAACDQALALDANSADALTSKGYALQLQGRNQAALGLFNQAIASEPNHADALTNRGTALLALNQPQAALASFDQAIAVQPNMPEAWNNRAAALWSLGQRGTAVSSVEEALALQPDYAEALSLRQQMRAQGY
ncbi:MAG: tetratricopeptide repeat protein [Elainellaceae cyanobacterium]